MPSLIRFSFRISLALFATVLARAESTYATPYAFGTFAGASSLGSADGTGTAARFYNPEGVAVDAAGNLYVADSGNHTIRKVTPAGIVSTFAGKAGVAGSADGTGDAARFLRPSGLAIDSAGNFFVSDTGNFTIRKITPAGVVTTLAGQAGVSGSADGTGSDARFDYPEDLALDAAGNVYVSDIGNATIRKISPGGAVTTFAGTADTPGTTDGLGAAARFRQPYALAFNAAGDLHLYDSFLAFTTFGSQTTFYLKKITPDGNVTTIATIVIPTDVNLYGSYPGALAFDATGNRLETRGGEIRRVAPDGTATTVAGHAGRGYADGVGVLAAFDLPGHMALDTAGNIYVSDAGNNVLRKVTPAGAVTTLAGLAKPVAIGATDGTGAAARFGFAAGVAVAPSGDVFIADTDNLVVRKITPAGVVTTFAGLAGASGTADGTGSAARFEGPLSIAVNGAGTVYIGESRGLVRMITPAGVVTTLGHVSSLAQGIAVDAAGNVYVSDYYSACIYRFSPGAAGTVFAGQLFAEGSNDGTGTNARFRNPGGLAVDAAGNLYVADLGNRRVRKITPAGVVTTFAGSGDIGSNDGTGAAAQFLSPASVAVDANGNLLVADTGNQTIRRITPAGVVTTLAGRPGAISDLDGSGPDAHFYYPQGIAANAAGDVYVTSGTSIRKGSAAGRPAITTQPQSVTAASGTNVQFSVTASADPAPSYQWYLNGTLLTNATAATLTVSNVQMANAGSYTVIVANPLGTATSNAAVLTVTTTPVTPPSTPPPAAGGGGGGAPSGWFLGALLALGLARRLQTDSRGTRPAR